MGTATTPRTRSTVPAWAVATRTTSTPDLLGTRTRTRRPTARRAAPRTRRPTGLELVGNAPVRTWSRRALCRSGGYARGMRRALLLILPVAIVGVAGALIAIAG